MSTPPDVQETAAAKLAAAVPKGALTSALSVGTARTAAQNQTLSNVRSRTATLLPTSAITATFATSVGLLANDTSHGGVRIPAPIAVSLLICVIAIGVITVVVQWPIRWSFDSGTDVYGTGGEDADVAFRAAIAQLETVILNNSARLRRTFFWFEVGIVLLGIQTILIVAGLVLART